MVLQNDSIEISVKADEAILALATTLGIQVVIQKLSEWCNVHKNIDIVAEQKHVLDRAWEGLDEVRMKYEGD